MEHSWRFARAAHFVHSLVSGAMERWSVKQRLHSMHVSQLLQRVWKAVSRSVLEWLNAEAGLYSVQAVHLYGQASGAHSWHSRRPSAFSRSWLSWKDLRHMLQALY